MFAAIRQGRSFWGALAFCLALLAGLGQAAHAFSHIDDAHKAGAAMQIDLADAYAPFDGELGLADGGCEHQHAHEGDSLTPAMAATLSPVTSAGPVCLVAYAVSYDDMTPAHPGDAARDGPDRPPRLIASA